MCTNPKDYGQEGKIGMGQKKLERVEYKYIENIEEGQNRNRAEMFRKGRIETG